MSEENIARKPGTRTRAVLKFLAIGCIVVLVLAGAAHLLWKYSGSNKWELEREKNGVRIYSMKIPGRSLKDWKAVRRIKLTLNGAVAAMSSTETEECAAWAPGCVSVQSIQAWNPQNLNYIHLYRIALPSPFSPREVLIKAQASQDPISKAVSMEFLAHPDDLPRNQCCFRITEMRNVWRFTPLENGEMEVELHLHGDQGVPYPIINHFMPPILYRLFFHLQQRLSKEKWQSMRFDSIKEK